VGITAGERPRTDYRTGGIVSDNRIFAVAKFDLNDWVDQIEVYLKDTDCLFYSSFVFAIALAINSC